MAGAFGRGDGDGWVWCDRGHKHWGRFGAAGLLVRSADDAGDAGQNAGHHAGAARVVLQHRALWSHQGGTWGLPGGARDSHESAVATALREAAEEAGLPATSVRPIGLLVDDHGGWAYTTVLAEQVGPLRPAATGGESIEVRWVDVAEVDRLPLHPGFAATWPRLRPVPAGAVLVVDGANVVGARGRGDGWWRDRAGANRRLRDALVGLAAAGIPADALPPSLPADGLDLLLPRVVLVVEGAARSIAAEPVPEQPTGEQPTGAQPAGTQPAGTQPAGGRVEVTAAGGSGDDTIVAAAVAAGGSHRVLVVTADRELAARAAAAGAGTIGPSWLLRLLEETPPPRG